MIRSPYDELIGVRLGDAGPDHAVAELAVTAALHQPGGIVHGGVYATLVETCASIAANHWLGGDGVAVGVSNHTDFLRAVRSGTLRAEASPVQRGRRLQLWEVTVANERGREVARGSVRLANVDETPGG